jgi:hypothetical protein
MPRQDLWFKRPDVPLGDSWPLQALQIWRSIFSSNELKKKGFDKEEEEM